jgi:hypothetical protein
VYEHKSRPLLSRRAFYRRMARHVGAALTLLFSALSIGVLDYHWTEDLSWLDSLLNASMILGGTGPVGEFKTSAGKLLASAYALFSGVIFLAFASIVMAPIAHRFLHKLHMDISDNERDAREWASSSHPSHEH